MARQTPHDGRRTLRRGPGVPAARDRIFEPFARDRRPLTLTQPAQDVPRDGYARQIGQILHGRAPERLEIERLLSRPLSGGVLVLRGEAGAGKSRLLADARQRNPDLRILQTTGIEAESELPYAGLHQLIWPLLSRVDDLEPPQARALRAALGLDAGDEPDRFLVSVALLTLLSEAADEQPILLLVDDVRWLDRATADALAFVARRLSGEPIALLAADRDGGEEPFSVPGLPQLRLGGIDAEAAAELLTERAGAPVSPRVAAQLAERTRGNPLALTELAELLDPEQLAGAVLLPDPVPIGLQLEPPFLERVRGLPEDAQRLLLIAAVADSPELAPILAAARNMGIEPDALGAAEQARLVHTTPGSIEFHHPLVRSALYQGADRAERDRAHLALADVLQGEGNLGRRAWHRAAATLEPDDDVAAELVRAAEQASRQGGPAATAATLQRAAQLTLDPLERGRRLSAAGRAAYLSGQRALAESLLEEAIPLLTGLPDGAQAAMTLGEVHLMAAEALRAIDVLTRAADEIGPSHPDVALDLLVPATVVMAQCLCADAQPLVARAEVLRAAGGDPLAVEYIASTGRITSRHLAEAGRLETYIPRGPVGRSPARDYWVVVTSTHPASAVPLPDALEYLGELAARCRADGLAGQLGAVLVALSFGEFQGGRLRAAWADASEALAMSRDAGQPLGVRDAAGVLSLVAGVQGRVEDCYRFAHEARPRDEVGNRWAHHALCTWALGLSALGAEDPEIACYRLLDVRPGGRLEQHWVTPLAIADLVEAAVRAGRDDLARTAAADLQTWAGRTQLTWALAAAARCRALVTEDPAEATAAFEESLRLHQQLDRSFHRARTRLLYGELLRRERRRVEAREQLRLALQIFEHSGAEPWAERARRELRATGQTLRRRDPASIGELTPQELQVARFVSRGGTNKEVAAQLFLSPRTVASHLQSIFRKLGVATRTALAQYDLEPDDED
ncbi:MAG: transcriptional regulator, LuxR family [Solirubrobacterales bacterium]|nr:transcriptional regulator, LuxR family [Solirubrobacterales bacterium]